MNLNVLYGKNDGGKADVGRREAERLKLKDYSLDELKCPIWQKTKEEKWWVEDLR